MRVIAGRYEKETAVSILPPFVDVIGKEARIARAKAFKISAMGTLACSDFWARATMAAMTVVEEERRAQSAPPARERAAGSFEANPAAPRRGASAPKRAAQPGQAAR
eukprot:6041735-Alexandrium_andersonii.AAC.1